MIAAIKRAFAAKPKTVDTPEFKRVVVAIKTERAALAALPWSLRRGMKCAMSFGIDVSHGLNDTHPEFEGLRRETREAINAFERLIAPMSSRRYKAEEKAILEACEVAKP